jgi:hypothetical protein
MQNKGRRLPHFRQMPEIHNDCSLCHARRLPGWRQQTGRTGIQSPRMDKVYGSRLIPVGTTFLVIVFTSQEGRSLPTNSRDFN